VYPCQGSSLLCARCRDVQTQGAQSRSQQSLTIMTTTIVITITTTTIITINTKACMFVPLLLSRSMGSGTKTFDFDCVIGLGCCAIVVAECCAVSGLFFFFFKLLSGLILAASNFAQFQDHLAAHLRRASRLNVRYQLNARFTLYSNFHPRPATPKICIDA